MGRHRNTGIQSILKSSAAVAGAMLLAQPLAHANPLDGRIISGAATVSNAGNSTTISQKSEGLVIDWSSFNIGSGQTTTFAQPNSQALVVNEIGGKSVSQIMGNLDANGHVVLINGNGVAFGKGSQVDVGSLVATSSGGSTSNLLAGKFSNAGSSNAAIANDGTITASQGGYIALVAPNVTNAGTISAKLGRVTLSGTSRFTVDFAGDGLVSFAAKGTTAGRVTNTGNIDGATVVLKASSAEGVAAGVVNVGGVITAVGAHERGGEIILDSSDGFVVTTGALNAAGEKGHGKVIEDANSVSIAGMVTAGQGGMWKVDPENLTIDKTAATTINRALNGGTSVWEQTTSGAASGTGTQSPGNGDIIIDGTISWNTGAMLYLYSYHSIDFNAPMYVTNGGCLTFQVNNGGTGDGVMQFNGTGHIDIKTSGTSFTLNGQGYNVVDNVSTLASDIESDPSGYFVLGQSYNATSDGTYTSSPISGTFTGTFYGLGNTISHLTVDEASGTSAGLFADIGTGGSVSGLVLTSANVTGSAGADEGILAGTLEGSVYNDSAAGKVTGGNDVGGLIGLASASSSVDDSSADAKVVADLSLAVGGGLVGADGGTVEDSFADGNVVANASGVAPGSDIAGGLIGSNSGTVASSYATGTVSARLAGGLIGESIGPVGAHKPLAVVEDSYATGAVTTPHNGTAGGLIGDMNKGSVTSSFSTGSVTGGHSAKLGGLIGIVSNLADISNVYATGDVGDVSGGDTSFEGGLIGHASLKGASSIETSYSTGLVTTGTGSTAGGLIGFLTGSYTLASDYWDTTTSGFSGTNGIGNISGASGVTGLTTSQFESGLPNGFNSSIWGESPSIADGMPYLLDNPPPA
jgi:filamentous hemagglutinin family protein